MKRLFIIGAAFVAGASAADRVKVESGILEGTVNSDSSVRIFKGVPFAAPPVGNLRWRPPQPVQSWSGARKAEEFGARCVPRRTRANETILDDPLAKRLADDAARIRQAEDG